MITVKELLPYMVGVAACAFGNVLVMIASMVFMFDAWMLIAAIFATQLVFTILVLKKSWSRPE